MLAAAGSARGLWRAVPRVAPRVVPRAAPRAALLGSYRWLSADAAPGVNLTAECAQVRQPLAFLAPAPQAPLRASPSPDRALARAQRIHEVTPDSPLLRLSVESGGCSGFSYKFDVDDVVPTDKDQCAPPPPFSPLLPRFRLAATHILRLTHAGFGGCAQGV